MVLPTDPSTPQSDRTQNPIVGSPDAPDSTTSYREPVPHTPVSPKTPPAVEKKPSTPLSSTNKQQDYINSLYSEIDKSYSTPKTERTWLTQKQQGPLKALRTYQGDIEANISKDNTSLTKIVVMEQEKKVHRERENGVFTVTPPPPPTEHSEKGKKVFFMIAGTLLIVLGVASVSALYIVRTKNQAVIEEQSGALMSFTKKVTLPVEKGRENALKTIQEQREPGKLKFGNVVYFAFTTTATSSTMEKIEDVSNVLQLIGPNIPPALRRSFSGSYMVGVYAFDTNEPFIILKTKDFTSSYAGMLKWEETMITDMRALFNITVQASKQFEDQAYRNKDLRVLRDENGKTVLLYSFIDRETLFITTNELLFNSLLGQYNVAQRIN